MRTIGFVFDDHQNLYDPVKQTKNYYSKHRDRLK